MRSDEVAERIGRYRCDNVIFTGGEPLLQQDRLAEVARLLRSQHSGYEFEVETNGTVLPVADFDEIVTRYNVSPKLANSGMAMGSRWARAGAGMVRRFAQSHLQIRGSPAAGRR